MVALTHGFPARSAVDVFWSTLSLIPKNWFVRPTTTCPISVEASLKDNSKNSMRISYPSYTWAVTASLKLSCITSKVRSWPTCWCTTCRSCLWRNNWPPSQAIYGLGRSKTHVPKETNGFLCMSSIKESSSALTRRCWVQKKPKSLFLMKTKMSQWPPRKDRNAQKLNMVVVLSLNPKQAFTTLLSYCWTLTVSIRASFRNTTYVLRQ